MHKLSGVWYGRSVMSGARLRRWFACGAASVAVLACATALRAQNQPTTSPAQQSPDPGMVKPTDHSQDPGMVVPAPHDVDPGIAPHATWMPGPSMSEGMTLAPGLPAKPKPQNQEYEPITAKQRLEWLLDTTLGPSHLAGGVVSAAYGTAVDKPPEDGPHWGGFGERYGVRLTGIATSNVMEGGIGAIWGEDPRYLRDPEKSFGARVASVLRQTVETRKRSGQFSPAYARYIAFTASNFLSNAWRPDSEADSYHAGLRVAEGFGGQLASNTWDEFWPSVHDKLFHKH